MTTQLIQQSTKRTERIMEYGFVIIAFAVAIFGLVTGFSKDHHSPNNHEAEVLEHSP